MLREIWDSFGFYNSGVNIFWIYVFADILNSAWFLTILICDRWGFVEKKGPPNNSANWKLSKVNCFINVGLNIINAYIWLKRKAYCIIRITLKKYKTNNKVSLLVQNQFLRIIDKPYRVHNCTYNSDWLCFFSKLLFIDKLELNFRFNRNFDNWRTVELQDGQKDWWNFVLRI